MKLVYGVNARQRSKQQVRTIQIIIVFEFKNTNDMVYGVNARQRWKQVRTIQIIIVFES